MTILSCAFPARSVGAIAAGTSSQSALMPASWTTLPHFAISVLIRSPNSAGELATGLEAEFSEALLHVGSRDHLDDLGVPAVDDLLRRPRRRNDAGERVAFLIGDAGFRHGRHVG